MFVAQPVTIPSRSGASIRNRLDPVLFGRPLVGARHSPAGWPVALGGFGMVTCVMRKANDYRCGTQQDARRQVFASGMRLGTVHVSNAWELLWSNGSASFHHGNPSLYATLRNEHTVDIAKPGNDKPVREAFHGNASHADDLKYHPTMKTIVMSLGLMNRFSKSTAKIGHQIPSVASTIHRAEFVGVLSGVNYGRDSV